MPSNPTIFDDEMFVRSRPGSVVRRSNDDHLRTSRVLARCGKKENDMRMFIVAALMLSATGATADEVDDAHRAEIRGRDTYWNCLAQEYSQDSNKKMSGSDFTSHVADVCPSERQSFRVSLVD